jgi:hypothetical protein
VPVALVRAGAERPTRAVLALSSAQAKRPSSAGLLAASLAARLAASGMELVVVAAEAPREDLAGLLGRAAAGVIVENPVAWLEREGRATDAVIVPGGRNGAMATARATRQAVSVGATVVAAADRESVTTSELAAEGLAVVTRRAVGALP